MEILASTSKPTFASGATLDSAPAMAGVGSMGAGGADSEVSTGTTIMATTFNGGVVLGADSRTSAGAFIVNRAARKISRLHDRIFVCRSGSAADTQALTGIVKNTLMQIGTELQERPRVCAAAALFQDLCYRYKDQLSAGVIVAGWDDRKGGQVVSIPIGGAKIEVPYAAGGSGSVFICGFLDNEWRPDMTKEEAKEFCAKAISLAMSRDGSSGGIIRLTTVTKDDVEEDVFKGDDLPVLP
eukprot:GHVU01206332.1.p1 GENE.GHVU01206332.1~~GHVU01206332.1.p1  ORF type:complete len:241 (-),score=39.55 GHVU01206332.1:385-1107(-)